MFLFPLLHWVGCVCVRACVRVCVCVCVEMGMVRIMMMMMIEDWPNTLAARFAHGWPSLLVVACSSSANSKHKQGKTLQTIVTILDHRPLLQHCLPRAKHPPTALDRDRREREASLWETAVKEWNHEMAMNRIPTKVHPKQGPARAGTLVICPVIALSQWKSEIEKFTASFTLCSLFQRGARPTGYRWLASLEPARSRSSAVGGCLARGKQCCKSGR